MVYISVAEAAERWQLSERRVQKFARDGRIPGAKKFSGSWAIPEDAARPQDPRKPGGAASQKPQAFLLPMPLMNTAFAPGQAAEAVAAISDPDLRQIACAELAYFSGRAEDAAAIAECYLDSDEPALRLSACLIFSYANLTLGQIQRARAALVRVQQSIEAFDADTPPELRAAGLFIVTTASVLLHLPPLFSLSPPPASCSTCLCQTPCRSFPPPSNICRRACASSPCMCRRIKNISPPTTPAALPRWKTR